MEHLSEAVTSLHRLALAIEDQNREQLRVLRALHYDLRRLRVKALAIIVLVLCVVALMLSSTAQNRLGFPPITLLPLYALIGGIAAVVIYRLFRRDWDTTHG